MRLRVLELPTQPVPVDHGPGDGSTVTYRLGAPSYVLVFDEVEPDDLAGLTEGARQDIRAETAATGVLVFRRSVDLPSAD